jgi:hypothetical protein
LWWETDLVDGKVVCRVVVTLDATIRTATNCPDVPLPLSLRPGLTRSDSGDEEVP